MKKMTKASELLWLLGILFVAFGVAVCDKANLGVSMIAAPAFVLYEAIAPLWTGFSVGMAEYLFQGILLLLLCLILRRFRLRFLLAFAVAVIYGYVLNAFLWVLGDVQVHAIWLRWVLLLIGDIITAFGIACFFRTYLPLQVYELFVTETAHAFSMNVHRVKWIFDISLLCISAVMALVLFRDALSFDWRTIGYSSFHSLGVGTLVTTLINSPLIACMSRLVDHFFEGTPRFPSLAKFLS